MSKKYQQKKDSIISEIQTTFKRYKYLSDTSIASIDFGDGRDSDDFIIVNRPKDERGYDLSDTGASDIFFREAADGFCSWFILQYMRGYKPFVTMMSDAAHIWTLYRNNNCKNII